MGEVFWRVYIEEGLFLGLEANTSRADMPGYDMQGEILRLYGFADNRGYGAGPQPEGGLEACIGFGKRSQRGSQSCFQLAVQIIGEKRRVHRNRQQAQ